MIAATNKTTPNIYREATREYLDDHYFGKFIPGEPYLEPVGPTGIHGAKQPPSYDSNSHPNLSLLGHRPFNRTHVLGSFFEFDLLTEHHKSGITLDQWKWVKTLLVDLPFHVIITKSKSGKGFHVFVLCEPITYDGTVQDAKRIIRDFTTFVLSHLPPAAQSLIDVSNNCLYLWTATPKPESFALVADNGKAKSAFTPTAPTTPAPTPDIFQRLTSPKSISLSPCQADMLNSIENYGTVSPANIPGAYHVNPHTLLIAKEAKGWEGDYTTSSDGSSKYTYCLLLAQADASSFKVISNRGNPETDNWTNINGKNVTYFPDSQPANQATGLTKIDAVVRCIDETYHVKQSVDVNGRQVERWVRVSKDAATRRCRQENIAPNESLDTALKNSWAESTIPFKAEPFSGRRVMNGTAATDLIVEPEQGDFPTWRSMWEHIGHGLDEAVADNDWCKENNINSGAGFLFSWFAFAFQQPTVRVPALSLYGDVLSGKTKVCEAMRFIVAPNLCFNVGGKLRSDFNGTMMKAVFLRCEETNLNTPDNVEFAKDLTTNNTVQLHAKGRPAKTVENVTRLVQTTNTLEYIPLGEGDERFIVIECPKLDEVDPNFDQKLEREAPAVLYALLNHKLPDPHGRLALPPLMTPLKQQLLDSLMEDAPHIQQLITLLKDNSFRKQNLIGPQTTANIARLLQIKGAGKLAKDLRGKNTQTYIASNGFTVTEIEVKDAKSRKRLAFEFTPVGKEAK